VLISNLTTQPLQIGFKWILFNSVSAFNALTIPPAPEQVGVGDGTPFQVYALANGPLFRRPDTDTPYDHLVVHVNGVPWAQVDDFPAGPGQVYRVNPITTEISFGNFDAIQGTGHGTVPALGDIIVATMYRYVAGGISGNVGAGKIVTIRTPVAGITSVTNLFSAYGGSDAEDIEETKRRAPELLRNRYRAVTTEDYEFLTAEASTELATQRCLEPRSDFNQPFGGLDRSPGNVNIIIVPNIGPVLSPTPPATPELIITARMSVSGPKYLPVDVSIAASAWQKAIDQGLISGPADVQTLINQKIQQYLHPVAGGLDGKGWQVGQNVFIADLYKAVMPSQDIGFISTLQIQGGTPLYTPPNRPFAPTPLGAWVRLADYELVCLGQINWLGPVVAV
jgi:predicted phage baseplate assembly protein